MNMDHDLLCKLEENIQPHDLESCPIPITVLGYGEISLVFKINECDGVVFKRMPLFRTKEDALQYAEKYMEYNGLLREAGLNLPPTDVSIVETPGRDIVVLYIGQQIIPAESFAHNLIHEFSEEENQKLLERIVGEMLKVYAYNRDQAPVRELALDSQLSNWALHDDELYYVDTSTPLYRKEGQEQILGNVDAVLESVPNGLRWIFRRVFIKDVIPRYYDERNVFVDISSNLNNERPDLIPLAVDVINTVNNGRWSPLTEDEVNKYYASDRKIWLIFLALRRMDRWVKTKLLSKRYEFTLPEKSSFHTDA
jgi:hypothetical protein